MKILVFILILFIFFLSSCNDKVVSNSFDFDYFTAIDKETNEIGVQVRSSYCLKTSLQEKLKKEYGKHYKDSFLLPICTKVSRELLINYSAGDIYNYKREEIEQKLKTLMKMEFETKNIEIIEFYVSSIKLSNKLREKLTEEHIQKIDSGEIDK